MGHPAGMIFWYLLSAILIAVVSIMHAFGLTWMARRLERIDHLNYMGIAKGTLGIVTLHVAEVVLFALIYLIGCEVFELDVLIHNYGTREPRYEEYLHFSFVTYTTVGYGDVTLAGDMRFIAGIEAMLGILLSACSASLAFLALQHIVRQPSRKDSREIYKKNHQEENSYDS